MNNKWIQTLKCIPLLGVLFVSATAQTTIGQITGVVTNINNPGGIAPSGVNNGDAVTATFTYGPVSSVGSMDAQSKQYSFDSGTFTFQVSIGIYTWNVTSGSGSVQLQDDHPVHTRDQYYVSTANISGTPVSFPAAAGTSYLAVGIYDESSPYELISGLTLPRLAGDMNFPAADAAFNQGIISSFGPGGPNDQWTINYSVNSLSLTAVPEPSTYTTLAGICALGFALWRRGRVKSSRPEPFSAWPHDRIKLPAIPALHDAATAYSALIAIVVFGAGLFSPTRAPAQVSNFSESPSLVDTLAYNQWAAVSFTTDALAYQFNSVMLRMVPAYDASGNFFVRIYADQSSTPGILLEALTGTSNPATSGDYVFTSGGLQLSPASTYWIAAGISAGPADYNWYLTASTNQTGAWSLGDTTLLSTDQGGSWFYSAGVTGVQLLTVSATAIPESTAFSAVAALFAAGAVGLRNRILRKTNGGPRD